MSAQIIRLPVCEEKPMPAKGRPGRPQPKGRAPGILTPGEFLDLYLALDEKARSIFQRRMLRKIMTRE